VITFEVQISFLRLSTDVDVETEDIGRKLSFQQRGGLVERLMHNAVN